MTGRNRSSQRSVGQGNGVAAPEASRVGTISRFSFFGGIRRQESSSSSNQRDSPTGVLNRHYDGNAPRGIHSSVLRLTPAVSSRQGRKAFVDKHGLNLF